MLADFPKFFVARGNTTSDIRRCWPVGVTLVPPSLMLLVELAVWRVEKVRQAVHLAFVAVLAAAGALQLLGGSGVSSALLIPISLLLGGSSRSATRAGASSRPRLTVLAPAPLLFLVLLLVVSPVSKLIFPEAESAVAKAPIRGHTPVVFVVFDEFSLTGLMDARHRIDASRYPNIARLAAGSTWYRNGTTVADATKLAVPSILTGERPDEDALPIVADYPENLFTLLGDSYSFDVDESATDLCPPRLCTATRPSATSRLSDLASDLSLVSLHLLLPEDLDRDLPAVDRTFSGFRGDAGSQRGRARGLPRRPR